MRRTTATASHGGRRSRRSRGNVLTNDLHPNGQPGADTPTSFVSWDSAAVSYGTFGDPGDGSYSYTLNNANARLQGLDDGE